ncbi:hypothetical protein FO519_007931 [Halicephalobus sp. NKZ332]|nr:hypothetical protein FO519_007931 [Halicephalobus sp. NKZ332]
MFSTILFLSTATFGFSQVVPMNTFPLPGLGGNRIQMPLSYTGPQRVPQRMPANPASMNPQLNPLPGSPNFNIPSMNPQLNSLPGSPNFNMPSMNSGFNMPSGNQFNMPPGNQFNMPQMNRFNMPPRQPSNPLISPHFNMLPGKFLQGASEEIVSQFKSIIRQPNVSYQDKIQQIESKVLPQLDSSQRTLYQRFMNESDRNQQSKRETINQAVGEMSQNAQTEFAKISEILKDQNLGEEQRWEKITQIYSSLDENLRNEFEKKFEPLV